MVMVPKNVVDAYQTEAKARSCFNKIIFEWFPPEYALAINRSIYQYPPQRYADDIFTNRAIEKWTHICDSRYDDTEMRRYIELIYANKMIFNPGKVDSIARIVKMFYDSNDPEFVTTKRHPHDIDFARLYEMPAYYAPAIGLVSKKILNSVVFTKFPWLCGTAMLYDIHEMDIKTPEYQIVINRYEYIYKNTIEKYVHFQRRDGIETGILKPVAISILQDHEIPDWLLNIYYHWCAHKEWPLLEIGVSNYLFAFHSIILDSIIKNFNNFCNFYYSLGKNHVQIADWIERLAVQGWGFKLKFRKEHIYNRLYARLTKLSLTSPSLLKIVEAL